VLPNIRVAAPCTADWNAMSRTDAADPEGRIRACGDCNKRVYNLSAMTRDEAEALIIRTEGKLCVRYFQRKDGTILLKDCSIGIKQRRRMRIVAAGTALLAATGAYTSQAAIRAQFQASDTLHAALVATDEPREDFVMGEMALPAEPPPPDTAIPVDDEPQAFMGQAIVVVPPAPVPAPTDTPPVPTPHTHTVAPRIEWPAPALPTDADDPKR
jgi:hypothetical protein